MQMHYQFSKKDKTDKQISELQGICKYVEMNTIKYLKYFKST